MQVPLYEDQARPRPDAPVAVPIHRPQKRPPADVIPRHQMIRKSPPQSETIPRRSVSLDFKSQPSKANCLLPSAQIHPSEAYHTGCHCSRKKKTLPPIDAPSTQMPSDTLPSTQCSVPGPAAGTIASVPSSSLGVQARAATLDRRGTLVQNH